MSLSRHMAARLAWGAIAGLSFSLCLVRIPHRYAGMGEPAWWFYLLEALLVLVWMAVGGIILWREGEGAGWRFLVAAMLAAYGSTYMQDARTQWALPVPWGLVSGVLAQAGGLGMFAFCFFFPDGKPVPRRLALALIPAWAITAAPAFYAPDSPLSMYTWPPAAAAALLLVLLAINIGAQLYRYRRTSDSTLRLQTKWVVFGILVGAIGNLVGQSAHVAFWDRPGVVMAGDLVSDLAHAFIPLSIGLAVLRYRLWEIDRIINRALVYGALTTSVALIFALSVGSVGLMFRGQGNAGVLVGTGLAALLFMPLRDRLQAAVDRWTNSERHSPYTVIGRLGNRLEGNLTPEEVLPVIVQTVFEGLRTPYVALALNEGQDRFEVAAVAGTPVPDSQTVQIPLFYQGKEIGRLIAGQPSELPFSPADLHLLKGVGRQAGPVIHAIQLTQALRRSREALVGAREEERRRLRNDLHDGVGPSLVAHTLKLAAVRDLIDRNPDAAREILTGLDADIRASLAEVRRVVYNLRPPLLDQLGLVEAIRRDAGEYRHGGLEVRVEAGQVIDRLPAAVEVAAYRITQEALNNVVRHAGARHCHVAISILPGVPGTRVGRRLRLEIIDDGLGVQSQQPAGVGLNSMRERAAEVGGACSIERAATGGTRVSAWLPIGESERT